MTESMNDFHILPKTSKTSKSTILVRWVVRGLICCVKKFHGTLGLNSSQTPSFKTMTLHAKSLIIMNIRRESLHGL